LSGPRGSGGRQRQVCGQAEDQNSSTAAQAETEEALRAELPGPMGVEAPGESRQGH